MPRVTAPAADLLLTVPDDPRELVARWDAGERIVSAKIYSFDDARREQLAQAAVVDVVRMVLVDGGPKQVLPLQIAHLAATTRVVLFASAFRTGIEWTDDEERTIRALAGAIVTAGWGPALRAIDQKQPGRLITTSKEESI